MNISSIIIVALALSMDAFSIAITLSTCTKNKVKKLTFAILVGILHFIFPLLGKTIGVKFFNSILINSDRILGIILLVLAIEMILDKKDNDKVIETSMFGIASLAISVSIDSFATGIGFYNVKNSILSSTIFSTCSFTFSILGIVLGNILTKLIKDKSDYVGIVLLIIMSVKYLF